MAEYNVTSKSTFSFDVQKEEQFIGNLSYKSWFQFNATIKMANKLSYEIEPKGFWRTTIELKEGEKVLLQFKMNWNGEIVVQSYFDELEKGYVFKHRGFFKESFVLTDQEGKELLVMKPQIKWKNMNYEYQVTTADTFETAPEKEILLMAALHFANYYMTMMSGQ